MLDSYSGVNEGEGDSVHGNNDFWLCNLLYSLRIYYHQGECVTLHSKDPGSSGESDDLMEIVHRLEAVTRGCETQEFILRRNEMGQLGFHVQQDGVITEVEPCGFAAKAGLKQGSRLVEVSLTMKSTFCFTKSFVNLQP